ncbi:MAG TPA: response regulator transcription factor, partial [Gemmatimonadaceae bacterium]
DAGGPTASTISSRDTTMSQETVPIRVMIVDDHELVREGLAELLARQSEVEVVATAAGGEEALEMFVERKPDVTLVDLRMTPMDGIDTIGALRRLDPDARVILLTTYETDEDIYQGLRAGAASYLLKGVGLADLIETIRAVHNGERRIPAPIAAKLAEHMSTPELTARQLDTLRLLVAGMSNREIGQVLHVTEGTVKAHVKAILAKFGARDRAHAAAIALKRGLVRAN